MLVIGCKKREIQVVISTFFLGCLTQLCAEAIFPFVLKGYF